MSGLASAGGSTRVYALFAVLFMLLPLSANAVAQTRDGEANRAVAQPFGPAPVNLTDGGVVTKWQGLDARTSADFNTIMPCGADPIACTSPEALQFIALVEQARQHDGLALLGDVNRSVNMSVRFMTDLAQYGQQDVWSSPLETLATGNGDCEDYAILKLAVLRAAGIDPNDLRLVILRNTHDGQDHALAAVRLNGAWRLLDNRYLPMLTDWQLADFRPLFVIDGQGVHAYADPNIALNGSDSVGGATHQQAASSNAERDASLDQADDSAKHL
jgi:predicted transglutaminase-like cysteine proteinase